MPRTKGTQTRTFQWSGSDLVSATNPENGTVTYQYDGAHHVTLRTDAKGQQTVYSYDAYGRLTQKRYIGLVSSGIGSVLQEQTDQEVDYYYDTNPIDANYSAQAWGRMTAVKFANGYSYQYSYSQPGRVIKRKLRLPDQVNSQPVDFESQYAWDNEGRMTSQSYPLQDPQTAGPQYGYQFDAMGRTSSMTGPPYNLTIATAAFGPAGELTSLNGDTRTYNILGQLTRITGGGIDLEYVYTAGQNNGRIAQQIDHVSGEQVTYQYDQLNRLSHAETLDNSWGYTYSYDGFGNLTGKIVTKGTAIPGMTGFTAAYDPATNHGSGYDANGNAPLNGECPSGGCYDVENRLRIPFVASSWGFYIPGSNNPNNFGNYVYDPWGKRVAWRNEAVSESGLEVKCELYVYGISGQRVASYGCGYQAQDGGSSVFQWTLKGYNVYFAGHMIQSNGVSVTTDRLGSVRKNGNSETFKYLPYGEELTSTADGREKFATYLRDSGMSIYYGLDYADQRYYDRGDGRFLTPDPGGILTADPRNPGTWNRYTYVNGDPVNATDRMGLWGCRSCALSGLPTDEPGQVGGIGCEPTGRMDNGCVDPGGGAAVDPLELVGATTAMERQNAAKAVADLGEGCQGVFSDPSWNIGTATLYQALQFNATSATYVDNFGPEAGLRLSQVGVVDPQTGQAYAGDPTVATATPPAGSAYAVTYNGTTIILNTSYYQQTSGAQAITLIHELLHLTYGGESDVDIAARFGIQYNVTPAGLPSIDAKTVAASRAISNWLANDCGRLP